MDTNNKYLKKETVSNYSSRNANHYDDPMNKNFVYGDQNGHSDTKKSEPLTGNHIKDSTLSEIPKKPLF